jgi:hypothetical protein
MHFNLTFTSHSTDTNALSAVILVLPQEKLWGNSISYLTRCSWARPFLAISKKGMRDGRWGAENVGYVLENEEIKGKHGGDDEMWDLANIVKNEGLREQQNMAEWEKFISLLKVLSCVEVWFGFGPGSFKWKDCEPQFKWNIMSLTYSSADVVSSYCYCRVSPFSEIG